MLTRWSKVYEEARAVVEDTGLRLKGLVEAGKGDGIDVDATLLDVTRRIGELDLPELVSCGVAFRIAAAQAEDPEDAVELLFQLGCDFISLRDWMPS